MQSSWVVSWGPVAGAIVAHTHTPLCLCCPPPLPPAQVHIWAHSALRVSGVPLRGSHHSGRHLVRVPSVHQAHRALLWAGVRRHLAQRIPAGEWPCHIHRFCSAARVRFGDCFLNAAPHVFRMHALAPWLTPPPSSPPTDFPRHRMRAEHDCPWHRCCGNCLREHGWGSASRDLPINGSSFPIFQ